MYALPGVAGQAGRAPATLAKQQRTSAGWRKPSGQFGTSSPPGSGVTQLQAAAIEAPARGGVASLDAFALVDRRRPASPSRVPGAGSAAEFQRDFQLGEQLGKGSSATVFAATERASGRQFAVKVQWRSVGRRDRSEALVLEAEHAQLLRGCRNAARLHAVYEVGGGRAGGGGLGAGRLRSRRRGRRHRGPGARGRAPAPRGAAASARRPHPNPQGHWRAWGMPPTTLQGRRGPGSPPQHPMRRPRAMRRGNLLPSRRRPRPPPTRAPPLPPPPAGRGGLLPGARAVLRRHRGRAAGVHGGGRAERARGGAADSRHAAVPGGCPRAQRVLRR